MLPKMPLEFTISVHHPLPLYFEPEVKNAVEQCFGDILEWNTFHQPEQSSEKPNLREPALRIFCKTEISSDFTPAYLVYRKLVYQWLARMKTYSPQNQRLWLGMHRNEAFVSVRKASHENVEVLEMGFGTLTSSTEFHQLACLGIPKKSIRAKFYHDTKNIEIEVIPGNLVSLFYSNIKTIIIHEDESTIALFLHLLCPTEHYTVQTKHQNQGTVSRKLKIRIIAIDGVTADQVGRSNMIKLAFPKSPIIREIISRLFFRCGKVPLIYAFMNVVTASAVTPIPNLYLAQFNCTYMANSILRRSCILQLQNPDLDELVEYFNKLVLRNSGAFYLALADVIHLVDDLPFVEVRYASKILFDWYMKNESSRSCNNDDVYIEPQNTRKVWRITITPTRQLLWPSEIMFENRILRGFDSEYACRVCFRDDSNCKLSLKAGRSHESVIEATVKEPMTNGLSIGPRYFEFLGWSNSQIREHGVWMYAMDGRCNTANEIRNWMGDFTYIRSVPLFMARMGQCFSKSQEAVKVPLVGTNVVTEDDILGGWNPETLEPYCFSDGVGKISQRLLQQVCRTMDLNTVPSALQIRYSGYKGMLVLDPSMTGEVDIVFRASMNKFPCRKSQMLEVVKVSTPNTVFLNRQLITILSHLGVRPGVFLRLQEEMLKHLTEMLLERTSATTYLALHCPLPELDYGELAAAGFDFMSEPFFKSMLIGLHRKAVDGIKTKARLEIDCSQGRNMYGVLDETATLTYGQVFVKYSIDINKPSLGAKVLKGLVLVTKNPCLQPGDVRMLEAVEGPGLDHIVDCIVFPQKGPRPHPNEMAGSDLDGDEYTVIWYEPLFFYHNRRASDFPVPLRREKSNNVTVSDMIDFLCHYIYNDHIGVIANAHLVKADEVGLDSDICRSIAQKFSIAVDFIKNGKLVTLDYSERPRKYPDFMGKERKADTYRSQSTLGKLFRICKDFEVEGDTFGLHSPPVKADPELELPNWETYKEQAEQSLTRYNRLLETVLETYGVISETEVMARAILSMHRRLQERQDKLEAEELVIQSVQTLWKNMKKEFMAEFTEGQISTVSTSGGNSTTQITEDILRKASAWYMVTYNDPRPKYVSFPWILSHELALIKRRYRKSTDISSPTCSTPVKNLENLLLASVVFNRVEPLPEDIRELCSDTCPHLIGAPLWRAVRVLIHWGDYHKLISFSGSSVVSNYEQSPSYYKNRELKRIQVNNLVYTFLKVIERMSPDTLTMEMLITFFRTCISLRFLDKSEVQNVISLNFSRTKYLGKKSMFTYHRIAVSGNLMALGLNSYFNADQNEHQEMDPVRIPWKVVQLYRRNNFQAMKEKLSYLSGVLEIQVRSDLPYSVFVSATGPPSALKTLKDILGRDLTWLLGRA